MDTTRRAPEVPPLHSADEIPRWFVWLSLVLVAGPSFAALAWFQHELFAAAWTNAAGKSAPAAITVGLAVAVDSFGAMSGVYWFRSKRNAGLRAWGRFFAITSVLGTTTLMVVAINRLFPGWELLGVIPAVIVFGSTKMVTKWQADRAEHRDILAQAAAAVAAADARDTARDREAAAGRTALLTVLAARELEQAAAVAALEHELAAARAQLDARPARLSVVPPSREVREQDRSDTRPLPVVVSGGLPDVDTVAAWIRKRRADGEPDGQRFASDAFGVSRPKIRDVHAAAKDLVDDEDSVAVAT